MKTTMPIERTIFARSLFQCAAFASVIVFAAAGLAVSADPKSGEPKEPPPQGPDWDAAPYQQKQGRFWRHHWYKRGVEHGNPGKPLSTLRVSSPDISLHPTFGRRSEARDNGLMVIEAREDLFRLTKAELYLELWGGHPGSENKRVSVNGRSLYHLPRVGTEEGHCTYSYPAQALRLTDLVSGYNAFQFAIDKGTTFWGHMLLEAAALRVALADDHPDLAKARLSGTKIEVKVAPRAQGEGFALSLDCPEALANRVSGVVYQGWYYGYDENGNTRRLDWHGFTKKQKPLAMLGETASAKQVFEWDTAMLPMQGKVAVRAWVTFKDAPDFTYLTAASAPLEIAGREGTTVVFFAPHDLPTSFWSRDNRGKTCTIDIDLDPARIERAELHVVTWTGGPGNVKEYFKLNGRHYPVADGSAHDLVYSRLPINPKTLKRGRNQIELLSDTEHHGIEIIYPGPTLAVRYR